jgi:hypothetical protein
MFWNTRVVAEVKRLLSYCNCSIYSNSCQYFWLNIAWYAYHLSKNACVTSGERNILDAPPPFKPYNDVSFFSREISSAYSVMLQRDLLGLHDIYQFISSWETALFNHWENRHNVTGDVVIQFCHALGKTPTRAYNLCQEVGRYKCCRSLVLRC